MKIFKLNEFINESYYQDLSPHTYTSYPKGCLNIGWLDGKSNYSKGHVSQEFIEKIKSIKMRIMHMGTHECEICNNKSGNGVSYISGEDNKIYAFPQMIVHYIEDHNYKPPQEFIDAVMKFDNNNIPRFSGNR